MDIRLLSQIDLNLLVVLQVLLEEGSVSSAAKRLFLTQSATSKALGRLREQLDDPLFIRAAGAMVPTPKARQLQEQLPGLLSAMQSMYTPEDFDPQSATALIRVAIAEHAGVLILPPLIEAMQRIAPGIRLKALNRVESQLDRLASGELDFAIHMQHHSYSNDFSVSPLFTSSLGLMIRKGHPLVGTAASDIDRTQLNFVRLILPDQNELEFLSRVDAQKRDAAVANTVFETSHMASAIEVIRRTDCVLPIAEVLSLDQRITAGCTWLLYNPFGEFQINYALVNHVRTDSSPLHRWVAQQIQNATAKVMRAENLTL